MPFAFSFFNHVVDSERSMLIFHIAVRVWFFMRKLFLDFFTRTVQQRSVESVALLIAINDEDIIRKSKGETAQQNCEDSLEHVVDDGANHKREQHYC